MTLSEDDIRRAEERRGMSNPGNSSNNEQYRRIRTSVGDWARRPRKPNTIPKQVLLTVTFNDKTFREVIAYEYRGSRNQREGTVIMATIERNRAASQLCMGRPYPLLITLNAYRGLETELGFYDEDIENAVLQGRTFTVETRNHKTYVWREVR